MADFCTVANHAAPHPTLSPKGRGLLVQGNDKSPVQIDVQWVRSCKNPPCSPPFGAFLALFFDAVVEIAGHAAFLAFAAAVRWSCGVFWRFSGIARFHRRGGGNSRGVSRAGAGWPRRRGWRSRRRCRVCNHGTGIARQVFDIRRSSRARSARRSTSGSRACRDCRSACRRRAGARVRARWWCGGLCR